MKAAWTRNFWAKAGAFLLAALIVPLMLAYAAGLAFSYGGMGKDFYTSDVCFGATSREAWEALDEYQRAVSGGYELDKIFPADNSYSNLRFTVAGEQGETEFSNVGEGDAFCYSTVFAGKEFSFYLAADLSAQDDVYWAKSFYDNMLGWSENAATMLILLSIAELILFVFLARSAGRREDGTIETGWQERIPFDLYLALDCFAGALLCAVGVEAFRMYADYYTPPYDLALLGVAFLLAALVLGLWMTLCTRVKAGKWWRHTVTFYVLRFCWAALRALGRGFRKLVYAIPLIWRTVLGCCVVSTLLFALASGRAGEMLLLTLFMLSIAACLFSAQLRKLQKEGEALAAGDLNAQVDTKWMYWDLKRHGENLNSIGGGMAIAVEKQLKSERLKTELITNVSHDIKTPLTSIINYADLLQHEHTDEQEKEYLDVLRRQAFRLKKLTEDLVEASKAATGNLPVNAARCSMNELLSQVAGEYGERLAAAELTLVDVLPEKELFCCVDGALLWRVLDNLLSNICKYAQSGTRVYLTLEKSGGDAVVTFKNTSRAALNIPAEELMERFVRGDSARSTEGNGLGLSIARSLTELQGGTMALAIDGDLFKAILRFPTVV